jgi:hypothetical protein
MWGMWGMFQPSVTLNTAIFLKPFPKISISEAERAKTFPTFPTFPPSTG